MKIVKKKKWYQNKENKNFSFKLRKYKNVISYLIKICLCIGMIIFLQPNIISTKEKINKNLYTLYKLILNYKDLIVKQKFVYVVLAKKKIYIYQIL